MLARTSWPIPFDPEEELPGIYWTPAQGAESDEVHPKLLQAIAERSGIRLHTAALYETGCGAPVGYLDLATDPKTHEACAVYHPCDEADDSDSTNALWFPMQPTVDGAVEALVGGLQRQGWL